MGSRHGAGHETSHQQSTPPLLLNYFAGYDSLAHFAPTLASDQHCERYIGKICFTAHFELKHGEAVPCFLLILSREG